MLTNRQHLLVVSFSIQHLEPRIIKSKIVGEASTKVVIYQYNTTAGQAYKYGIICYQQHQETFHIIAGDHYGLNAETEHEITENCWIADNR